MLDKALLGVRAQRGDLSIRTDRWPTRMTLPAVEELLRAPLKMPETMERWSGTLKETRSSGAQVDFAGSLLGVEVSSRAVSSVELPQAPAELRQALGGRGVLSLGPGLLARERAQLLGKNNPLEPVRKEAFEEFARLLRLRPAAYAAAIEAELDDTAAGEPRARKVLLSLLGDADKEVVQAALSALGGIGAPKDAATLAAFWKDPTALLRDSVSASLGRMGQGAKEEIARGLKSSSPKIRALAALAAARSTSPEVLALLEGALSDKDEEVQRGALSALLAVQNPLRPERRALRPRLKVLSTRGSDAVRVAALRALGDISEP